MHARLRQIDTLLIVVPLMLMLIGMVVIYTVSFPQVGFNLARSQIIYAVVGLITAFLVARVDYRIWQNTSWLIYGLGILLLIAVMLFGSKQFGAARWIDLGSFHLQPSEIFKLIIIIGLSRLLSQWSGNWTVWRFLIVAVLVAVPAYLTFRQPDLGTASVLVAISFVMVLFAKVPWRWWLIFGGIMLFLAPLGYFQLQPYQKARIHTFLTPDNDPKGKGYNVRQATIAIGSGGLFGQGLGKGSQSQLNFLPVAHTDFIFAGLAEATGLLGCSILLILYFFLIHRLLKVAEVAKDEFGYFLALGTAAMFGFQVFINIGMNLGIMPVTGIPLPLVSSGGTSLIVSLLALAIIQSVYIRHKKISF